jgi:hypothetical protein
MLDYDHNPDRPYSLTPFSIIENFATPEEVMALTATTKSGMGGRLFRFRQKNGPYYRRPLFMESRLNPYDPNILRTPKSVCLQGYWQSEKYFAEISTIIVREFALKDPPYQEDQKLAEKIQGTESVSIHFRRGDYTTQAGRALFVNLDMDYYLNSIRAITEKTENPHFFVFSDDPDWVEENFHVQYPMTIVDHNRSRAWEDLRLMSMCKHNIIANSSFSWWGAWLNRNPEKLVFAPSRWFSDASFDTRDLIPNDWCKVQA